MKEREMVCIRCPLGCTLQVELQEDNTVMVTGNQCPRGAEYGRNELTDPRRTVTTTVRRKGSKEAVVSVKTASEIPKGKIKECINVLAGVTLDGPVRIGDVVIKNVAETGVDVVATRNVEV